MDAQICRQAAVDTGPSGLCGITSTSCASARAQIFLLVVMPPTAQTSGRIYWQAWRAISTSNSRRLIKRSPVAIGTPTLDATSAMVSTLSGGTGSSRIIGWYGSTARPNATASGSVMPRCTSSTKSKSFPTASLQTRTFSTSRSMRLEKNSPLPSGALTGPLQKIFAALKPISFSCWYCSASSFLSSVRCMTDAYTRTLSRVFPPRSS